MIQATPVILCGGSGTRLWPLSRTGFPKQFLCLTGKESLFQQAAQRLTNLGNDHIALQAPLIVTGEDHRFLASEQLREVSIPLGAALLEPIGRNTSPALTLAALTAMEGGQDRVLVVSPADQTVANDTAFMKAVQGSAHMGDVLTSNSQNTLVHATSRLVSLVGVSDLIVVETPDAVLVADKTRSQDVKDIVAQLQNSQREEHNLHRKVHRLANPGTIPLEIIEVQTGSYLREDDNVRFEDSYGRTSSPTQ